MRVRCRKDEPLAPKRLMLKTWEGKEIKVMMRDFSTRGVGFELTKGKDARLIKRGQKVSLSCTWAPAMIRNSTYKIQNITGFRVGLIAIR